MMRSGMEIYGMVTYISQDNNNKIHNTTIISREHSSSQHHKQSISPDNQNSRGGSLSPTPHHSSLEEKKEKTIVDLKSLNNYECKYLHDMDQNGIYIYI